METNTGMWWYQMNGEQKGPVSGDELKLLIGDNLLQKDNLVWKEGMAAWVPISTTEFLSSFRTDIPPPITNVIDEKSKWYNNTAKLWLSILFWPATVYGVYKTRLMTKKTKQIIAGVCVALVLIGVYTDDGTGPGSGAPRQSPFDNSVDVVERYLKHDYLRDPDSYEGIHWSKVRKNSDGTYSVDHQYRARNGFGGLGVEEKTFMISSDGEHVLVAQ